MPALQRARVIHLRESRAEATVRTHTWISHPASHLENQIGGPIGHWGDRAGQGFVGDLPRTWHMSSPTIYACRCAVRLDGHSAALGPARMSACVGSRGCRQATQGRLLRISCVASSCRSRSVRCGVDAEPHVVAYRGLAHDAAADAWPPLHIHGAASHLVPRQHWEPPRRVGGATLYMLPGTMLHPAVAR